MGPNFFGTEHQFVAYFAQFPASKFTSVTGGDSTNDVNQQFPGGGGPPVNIIGPSKVSAVQLSKPYDHVVDKDLNAWAAAWDAGAMQELTLIVQPVTSEGTPVPGAASRIYHGCAKQSYKHPDVNVGSANTAMLQITVQPRRVL